MDTFLLQDPLVEALALLRGHVGLVSGEQTDLVRVGSLVVGQRAAVGTHDHNDHFY